MGQTAVAESSVPAEWEPTVKKLKSHPEIDNPWALANWMADQGYNPGGGKGKEAAGDFLKAWQAFKTDPGFDSYMKRFPAKEANSPSAMGQLYRPHAKEAEHFLRFNAKLCEAAKGTFNEKTREVPVYIISEGPGNKVDKHFYTKEALAASFQRFDGAKCYADHPDKIQEAARPERSVRDIVGYFHSPELVEAGGLAKIKAVLKINQGDSFQWAWDMLKEALDYAEKYPEKDYIGISINADGVTKDNKKDDGVWHDVQEITRVVSADIVTQPAAGGKPLRESNPLLESVKTILHSAKAKEEPVKTKVKESEAEAGEALMKAAEALKAVRAAMAKNPDHEKAYGEAMDDIHGKLDALLKHEKGEKEGEGEGEAKGKEMAPPPAKDGQLEKPKDQSEEEAYASESARYASGKMTEGEKAMFERWQGERMARKAIVDKQLLDKKLSESGLPAWAHDELRTILQGKSEKEMDRFIESRKKLLEGVVTPRSEGAGAKGAGPAAPTKLQEALASKGLLRKEGGK